MLRFIVCILLLFAITTSNPKAFSPEEEKLIQHIKDTLDSHLLEG
jgi:hypothetical protein